MNAHFHEQIHLYCEGLLPEYAETALFAELAVNADLRAEMSAQMKLLGAVQQHAATLRPLPQAKGAIFANLGLQMPEKTATPSCPPIQQAASSGAAALQAGNSSSTFSTLALSILSSCLTAALILLFFRQGGNASGNGFGAGEGGATGFLYGSSGGAIPALVQRDTIRETNTIVRYIPLALAPSRQSAHSTATDDAYLREAAAPVHNIQEISTPEKEILAQEIIAKNTETKTADGNNAPLNAEALDVANLTVTNLNDAQTTPVSNHSNRSPLGLIVGLRGVRSRSFPEASVESGSYPMFNNTAFSLMLPLSRTSAIGIEAGQEAYFLQYRTILPETTQLVGIEKNPVLAWAAVRYQHTFLPDDLFSPILHLSVGGTSIGAIGRTLMGVQYAIDAKTRFQLGVEASSLLYIHRDAWYLSPNVGVSYGISVDL